MNFSPTERESPPEGLPIHNVAAWLKAAREERGETLDDVAGVTRIGKNYLEAIEEGDLAKLPSQAYTRGFIRLYATHLGLSAETALAMMDSGPTAPVAVTGEAQAGPDHVGGNQPAYRRRLFLIAVLVTVLGLIYLLLKKPATVTTPLQNSRINTPSPQQAVAPAASPQSVSPPQSSAPPQQAPPQETGVNQGVVLRLKAVSDGKITITIDGSFSQEYDLVTGDLVEWKADDAIRLDLNNAASVEGELDGVKMAPFGEPGSAAHLIVKADGIHKE